MFYKIFLKKILAVLCRILVLLRKESSVSSPKKILLIASGYIGDTFWAIQIISNVEKYFPNAEIHLCGRPFIHDLAHGFLPEERIHEAYIVSDRTREPIRFAEMVRTALKLKKEIAPDLAIDLMGNRFSAFFTWLLQSQSVGPSPANECAGLYSNSYPWIKPDQKHLSERPQNLFSAFTATDFPRKSLQYPQTCWSKEEIIARWELPKDRPFVFLFPGAGWEAKRWDKTHFHELTVLLIRHGFTVLISGTKKEYPDLLIPISDGLDGAFPIAAPLSEVLSLLPFAACAVGNDSGLIHLAAVRIPTVVLFCQTNPAFCGPLGPQVTVLRASCPLSPKHTHFCCDPIQKKCSRPECMQISPETVFKAVTCHN